MNDNIMGIYQIKNIINNKIYIGSSKDIKTRWQQHLNLLNKGKHHSYRLQKDWDKYKQENFKFEILEKVSGVEKLLDVEQKWIDETLCYKSENGYNISKNTKWIDASSAKTSDIIYSWREIFREILSGEYSEIYVNFHISQVKKILFGHEESKLINQDKFNKLILDLCDSYINLFNNIDSLTEDISVEPRLYNKYFSVSLFDICKINNKEKILIFLEENDFDLISFYDGRSGETLDAYRDNYVAHEIVDNESSISLFLRTLYKDYDYGLYVY